METSDVVTESRGTEANSDVRYSAHDTYSKPAHAINITQYSPNGCTVLSLISFPVTHSYGILSLAYIPYIVSTLFI